MPRDKTVSHKKIMAAAKAEFLEKGYEDASMRSIGDRAGITAAGLYKHYKSKEDMFYALTDEAAQSFIDWGINHISSQNQRIAEIKNQGDLFMDNQIELIKNVVFPQKDEFILILCKSRGTKYENFLHNVTKKSEEAMLKAMDMLRQNHVNVPQIEENELHILLSAYNTALLEPIIHDYSLEETQHCLDKIEEFFMPGWQKIMGF